MEWTRGYVTFPCIHPQRSCKLGEWHSPSKNGRGMPFPRVPPQFDHWTQHQNIQFVFSSRHHCHCYRHSYSFSSFSCIYLRFIASLSFTCKLSSYLVHNIFPCFTGPTSLSCFLNLQSNTNFHPIIVIHSYNMSIPPQSISLDHFYRVF